MSPYRLVSYKRVDVLLEAFSRMPDRQLLSSATGRSFRGCVATLLPMWRFTGSVSDAEVSDCIARAKEFVYAGAEDFGIAMVEAQSCGTPVRPSAEAGRPKSSSTGRLGLLFDRQTAEAVVSTVLEFEREWHFDPARIRSNAKRFDVDHFRKGFRTIVNNVIQEQRALLTGSDIANGEVAGLLTTKKTARPLRTRR
jgi:glycosyltransferase involved in cell wall biosynthesis